MVSCNERMILFCSPVYYIYVKVCDADASKYYFFVCFMTPVTSIKKCRVQVCLSQTEYRICFKCSKAILNQQCFQLDISVAARKLFKSYWL